MRHFEFTDNGHENRGLVLVESEDSSLATELGSIITSGLNIAMSN